MRTRASSIWITSHSDSDYPPLFFSGTSRGVHGNEAIVEGLVRMGWSGVVRWQFVSFLFWFSLRQCQPLIGTGPGINLWRSYAVEVCIIVLTPPSLPHR
jgi:hypothetical protein